MFILTVISTFLGMHLFAWVRLHRQIKFSKKIFCSGLLLCILLTCSIIIVRLFPDNWPEWVIKSAWHLSFFWVGFLFYAFVLQLGFLILEFGALTVLPKHYYRQLKYGLGILAVPAALLILCFGYYTAAGPPTITEYFIHTDKTDTPLKVALVADNHLGIQSPPAETKRLVHALEKESPDLCLFAGDIFNDHPGLLDAHINLLAQFNPPGKKFAVLGNHEIYFGEKEAVELMERSKIHLLRNNVYAIPETNIQLAGIDDPARKPDRDRVFNNAQKSVLKQLDADKFTILITHRPKGLNNSAKSGVDLQLSGHTHNGQIFPFKFLVALAYPYTYGEYRKDNTRLIVTRGFGTWGPSARVLSPPEIVILHILPQDQENNK
ncbi:MAG: metallophosphoesterase [Thermodesulfobacteriota bacterium]